MHTKQDEIQRFLLEEAHIQGKVAYLNEAYQEIMAQREYPPIVQRLLGETLIACLLLAEQLKFEGSFSLQFEGDKRLPLILVQCTHQLHLRALAKFEPDLDEAAYADAFLHGQMVLTLQSQRHTQNYQSKLPIQSLSIADNLMSYFAQSEQIASFIWLATTPQQAGGFLIQLLPTTEENIQKREQFWEYALHIGQTITEDELFTLDNETLLYRLYHETPVRLFDKKTPKFQCRCTPERMHQVLRVLGKKECDDLLKTHKTVEAHCEFCNKTYPFDAIDVEMIFNSGAT